MNPFKLNVVQQGSELLFHIKKTPVGPEADYPQG